MSRKLIKKGYDSVCVQTIIEKLCETGLLDDRRYACLWLETRIARKASSPLRLLSSLRSRNIDRHDADLALKETLDEEAELQLLHRFVQKYAHKRIKKSGSDDSVQSYRYLLKSEGFSAPVIQRFFDMTF
ncbi:MAG: RecX family transcriptional regulator [Treponema sp.]|nr:RecX family transcriptional regulator [Treponema sp.]